MSTSKRWIHNINIVGNSIPVEFDSHIENRAVGMSLECPPRKVRVLWSLSGGIEPIGEYIADV